MAECRDWRNSFEFAGSDDSAQNHRELPIGSRNGCRFHVKNFLASVRPKIKSGENSLSYRLTHIPRSAIFGSSLIYLERT